MRALNPQESWVRFATLKATWECRWTQHDARHLRSSTRDFKECFPTNIKDEHATCCAACLDLKIFECVALTSRSLSVSTWLTCFLMNSERAIFNELPARLDVNNFAERLFCISVLFCFTGCSCHPGWHWRCCCRISWGGRQPQEKKALCPASWRPL